MSINLLRMLVTMRTMLTTGRGKTLTLRGTTGVVGRMGFPATLTGPLGTHAHITDIIFPSFTGTGFPWVIFAAPGLTPISLSDTDVIGRAGRTGRARITHGPGIPILRSTLFAGPGHGKRSQRKQRRDGNTEYG